MKTFSRGKFLKNTLLGVGIGAAFLRSGALNAKIKGEEEAKYFDGEKINGVIRLEGRTLKIKNLTLLDHDVIQGPGKIILETSGTGVRIKGNNVTIRDVHFLAAGNNKAGTSVIHLLEGCANVLIENCYFDGGRYCVLRADQNTIKDSLLSYKKPVENLSFCKNTVIGSFSRHLYLHNIHGIFINGNTFKGSLRDSIRLRQAVKKVIISDNQFRNIGKPSKESSDAIDTYWSGEELIISNNIIEEIATHGLDIKGISPDRDGRTSKVIIKNNILKACRYSGVLLSSGALIKGKRNCVSNFVISDNLISGCNLEGSNPNDAAIFLRHGVCKASINANHIEECKGHGIVLGNFEEKAIQSSNINVTNNQVYSGAKGLSCLVNYASDNVLVSGNQFGARVLSDCFKNIQSSNDFKARTVVIGQNLNFIVNDNS